jgi:hypothetical protein
MLKRSAASKAELVIGGISLICFFAFVEAIPFGSRLNQIPVQATVHLFILLLPNSFLSLSSNWLLIPGSVFFLIAINPFFYKGFHLGLLILICLGLSFFIVVNVVPHAGRYGQIWSLFFFTWLGANLWANEIDYLYASIIAAFFGILDRVLKVFTTD